VRRIQTCRKLRSRALSILTDMRRT